LPKAFDDWFAKACARRVSERFSSINDAASALAGLEAWRLREREQSAFELAQGPGVASGLELDPPQASRRGLVLAGILVGASTMLAALGYYVVQRTRAADAEAALVAASARAVIEGENARKLKEAEAAFWARQADAGAPPKDAGAPPARRRKR
jgi:hypothetical protein